jgi:signal transduction histidine kinase
LDFAKPLNLQIDRYDLNQLISQAGTLAHKPYSRKAQILFRLGDNLPEAQIDGILIEQVLHVIISNALEAIDEGGAVEIESQFLNSRDEEPWAMVRITDNGRGIPLHIRQKLFRPFSSSKEGGTGLGLAQAKKIVDMHGGEIAIESLDRGTRVVMNLPLTNKMAVKAEN